MRIQNENGEEKLANKGCASEKNYQHEFNPLGYSFTSTFRLVPMGYGEPGSCSCHSGLSSVDP